MPPPLKLSAFDEGMLASQYVPTRLRSTSRLPGHGTEHRAAQCLLAYCAASCLIQSLAKFRRAEPSQFSAGFREPPVQPKNIARLAFQHSVSTPRALPLAHNDLVWRMQQVEVSRKAPTFSKRRSTAASLSSSLGCAQHPRNTHVKQPSWHQPDQLSCTVTGRYPPCGCQTRLS